VDVDGHKGFTVIELLIITAVIGITAALAFPGLRRARIAGNEASAIASMRAINSGQASYAASAAKGGFATSLTILGTRCGAAGEGFVSKDLGSAVGGIKSGYRVVISSSGVVGPRDCNNRVSRTAYRATATPVTLGTSGGRSFITSQAGTIYATRTAQGVAATATAMVPAKAIQ